MGKKVYEAIAVTGEYQSHGETKKRYHRCGVVFETERGLSLKLESIPVGAEWNGWMFFAEPRQSADQAGDYGAQSSAEQNRPAERVTASGSRGYVAPAPREQAQDQPPFDDDIPF